jgi:hypothetical protein
MTATENDACTLRDLIDDLCSHLERSGANETGLPPVYAAMEIRHKRSQADELIEMLTDAVTAAEHDASDLRSSCNDLAAQLDAAEQARKKVLADLEALRALHPATA